MKKNLFLLFCGFTILLSCEHEDKNNPVILKDYSINALAIDNSNTIWAGTDSGLFRISDLDYELVEIKNLASVTALSYEGQSNILWVGTSAGLIKMTFDGSEPIPDSIPSIKLSNDSISSIYLTSNSEKWFSTGFGVTRNAHDIWQKEKFKKNLSGTITAAVFEKVGINSIASWDGDFYFASNGRSVYRAYGWNESVNAFSGASQLLKPYNGTNLSDTVFVVFVDSKGQQWMGGREGMVMHTGHDPKSDNVSFISEMANLRIHCIAEAPDGKIWAGTEDGISIYNGSKWTKLSISLPNKYVTAIAFENNGKTWIGTKKGILLID